MTVNLRRYAMVYIVTLIVGAVLIAALRHFTGLDLATSSIPLLPAMFAAMYEGNKQAIEGAPAPKGKEAWIESARMTGIALGFNILLGLVVFASLMRGQLQMQPILWFLGFLALYGALWLVTNRIFLGMGYKNATSATKKR